MLEERHTVSWQTPLLPGEGEDKGLRQGEVDYVLKWRYCVNIELHMCITRRFSVCYLGGSRFCINLSGHCGTITLALL